MFWPGRPDQAIRKVRIEVDKDAAVDGQGVVVPKPGIAYEDGKVEIASVDKVAQAIEQILHIFELRDRILQPGSNGPMRGKLPGQADAAGVGEAIVAVREIGGAKKGEVKMIEEGQAGFQVGASEPGWVNRRAGSDGWPD